MKTLEDRRNAHVQLLHDEIQRLTRELKSLGAKRVVLFGSMAKGRADLRTDIDLLVVMESADDFVIRTAALYRRLKPKAATDILAYTPDEFDRIRDRPFIRKALNEGVVLHAAEPA